VSLTFAIIAEPVDKDFSWDRAVSDLARVSASLFSEISAWTGPSKTPEKVGKN